MTYQKNIIKKIFTALFITGTVLFAYIAFLPTASATSDTYPVPLAGLVSYWGFNEGSGTTVSDSSGNGYSGTIVGNPIWTTLGKVGGALNFDGNSYVNIADNNNWNIGTQNYTISMWINPSQLQYQSNRLISSWDGGSSNFGTSQFICFLGYANVTGSVGCNFGDGSTWATNWLFTPADTVSTNKWYNLQFVFDTTSINIYVDGVLKASATRQALQSSRKLQIGGWAWDIPYGGINRYFKGLIDEVAIYNRALSADEIRAIYEYVPPTILSPYPVNNTTNVSIYTPIKVFFSKAMDKNSVQDAFSVNPSVGGAFSWDGNNMIYTPSSLLALSTPYTVTIGTGAKDLAGNPLSSPYTFSFTTVAVALDPSLIAYWRLDETSGNAADSVDTNTLTNNGGATYSAGKINNAVNFGANNSSKSLTLASDLGIHGGTMSVSAWVNVTTQPTGLPWESVIFWQADSGTYTFYKLNYANDSGTTKLRFDRGRAGISDYYTSYSTTLTIGTWYYVTATYDGTYIRLYLNGSLVAEPTASIGNGNASASTDYVSLGRGNQLDSDMWKWFSGSVDDVGVYNRALSTTEISDIYNSYLNIIIPITPDLTVDAPYGSTATTNPDDNSVTIEKNGTPMITLPEGTTGNNVVLTVSTTDNGGGMVIVSGATLPEGATKTIYVPKHASSNYVCVNDNPDVVLISSSCDQPGEVIVPCSGSVGAITCTVEQDVFAVSGLQYSGVGEILTDSDKDGSPDIFDCSPNNAAIHPGTIESCNNIDDNCNGKIDEGDGVNVYRDSDKDGYGSGNAIQRTACTPASYVTNADDQCPTIYGKVYKGCPAAVSTDVKVHYIDQAGWNICGTGKTSCTLPAPAYVRVFDRNNADFQKQWGKNPSGSQYPNIMWSDAGLVGDSCWTDSNGNCTFGVNSNGDYLTLAYFYDPQWWNWAGVVGSPVGANDSKNGVATKELSTILMVGKDGQINVIPASKKTLYGSALDIVYPDSMDWGNDTTVTYPFILTSDSDWTTDVCLDVPAGYKLIGDSCQQTFVNGETKALLFQATDIGSPKPDAKIKIKATHQGKVQNLALDIPGQRNKDKTKEQLNQEKSNKVIMEKMKVEMQQKIKDQQDKEKALKAKLNPLEIEKNAVSNTNQTISLWSKVKSIFGSIGNSIKYATVYLFSIFK